MSQWERSLLPGQSTSMGSRAPVIDRLHVVGAELVERTHRLVRRGLGRAPSHELRADRPAVVAGAEPADLAVHGVEAPSCRPLFLILHRKQSGLQANGFTAHGR